MNRAQLRGIPSVDKILRALDDRSLPHPVVVDAVRRELAAIRQRKSAPNFDELLSRLRLVLDELRASRLQPVINGTGILIHTNFGRAPLGAAVIENLSKIGSSYCNLEYGLTDGARGGRAAYLERSLALLCEAEAATVVNNNAAALILILTHFCEHMASGPKLRSGNGNRPAKLPRNEVIISRGELIQIGGGFRIPEILESSGARLCEVGTTNKTSLKDYARAITRETALILKVHRSNFYMGGFVESPHTDEIAELARTKQVPFVEDLGSGAIIETESIAGMEHETTPAELMRSGVDLVCFSGDKLLGGPQAGIVVGAAKQIAALKREPLFRALRCDKLTLSALEATVDACLREGHCQPASAKSAGENKFAAESTPIHAGIPVLEMLRISNDELRIRAAKIVSAVKGLAATAAVGTGKAQAGGGTLPRSVLASVTVDLTHGKLRPQELAARLRAHPVPIIGYVVRGKLKLDLRTIFPKQDAEVIDAIKGLSA